MSDIPEGIAYIEWSDLNRAAQAFKRKEATGSTDWDEFQDKYLPIPDWFDHSLDPLSKEYKAQQDKLWQMMVGESAAYDPIRDELTGVEHVDALKTPGFYSGDISKAGEHLIAMGHLIKISGLRRGDRVIEYGAGFGQIALALARLGIIVDTVDIDKSFCNAVQAQAEWFGVELNSHHGEFGDNPTGQQYNTVLFYESFHHARDFVELIAKMRKLLAPGGKVLMAGEPIQPSTDNQFRTSVPYPWGVRLHAEVGAIVRFRRWYELGFHEEFLFRLFNSMGFQSRKHQGLLTRYATVYEFVLRPDIVKMSEWRLPPDIDAQWHGFETSGRWTTSFSTFPLDQTDSWSRLRVVCRNHHPSCQLVKFKMDDRFTETLVDSGAFAYVTLERAGSPKELCIETDTVQPSSYGLKDERHLGIFVEHIEYIA